LEYLRISNTILFIVVILFFAAKIHLFLLNSCETPKKLQNEKRTTGIPNSSHQYLVVSDHQGRQDLQVHRRLQVHRPMRCMLRG
jgi:hypothetical protein